MTIINKKEHKGLVLDISYQGFYYDAATFSSLFYDEGVLIFLHRFLRFS